MSTQHNFAVTVPSITVRVPHRVASVRLEGNRVGELQHVEHPSPSALVETNRSPVAATSADRLATVLEQLSAQFDSWKTQRRSEQAELATVAVDLATALVERLFRDGLDLQAFDIQKIVEDLVRQCGKARPVEVRLHPNDWQALEQTWGTDRPTWAQDEIEWRVDEQLPRGSCQATHQGSGWLFDWQNQLAEMRTVLMSEAGVTH